MKPITVVIVVTVAIALVLVFMFFRRKGDWGFKEMVKHPELWGEMSEAHREVDRQIEAAKHWTDDQVAGEVETYLFNTKTKREAWGKARALEGLGERVYAPVLGILSAESRREQLVKETGKDLVPEAPFNRACALLGDTPPPEVIQPVASFLNEPSKYIRQDAALVIGKVGSPEIVTPLRKALNDSEDYVRGYALMGLQFAVKNGRLSQTCREELFPDLMQLLSEGKNADYAADLLVEFNATKAKDFFMSEAFFTPRSESLHEALEALANHKVPISRERLLKLIRDLEASEIKYPQSYSLAHALRCLGQNRQADDLKLFERLAAHDEERVARGAAEGLLAYHSLEGFSKRIWDTEQKSGFASLTPEQRHWIAVSMFDGEVNNGGLSQYFFNSSGDYWREALSGLEAMGAGERATILKEAVAKFGTEAPSKNREQRQDQLAKLARKDDALFDALDSRYYASKEVIDVLMTKYVIKNAPAFK